MARVIISRNNFQTGVLSLRAQANTDIETYNWGLSFAINFAIRRLGGLYKRSGTYFYKQIDSLYTRVFEYIYSASDSCIVCISLVPNENKTKIFLESTVYKEVVPPPIFLNFLLTKKEIDNLNHFVIGNIFWLYIPFNESRSRNLCGFYYIEPAEKGFSFSFYGPLQFSNQPMVPLKLKRYLYIQFNEDRTTAEFRLVILKRLDGIYLFDNNINQDWLNRVIIFQYVRRPLANEDINYAGTYWFKFRINNIINNSTFSGVSIDIETPPNEEIIQEDTLPGQIEWMVQAFDSYENNIYIKGYLGQPGCISYYKGRLIIVNGINFFISKLGDDILNFEYGITANSAFSIKFSEGNIGNIKWLIPFNKLIIGTSSGIYVSDGIVVPTQTSFILEAPSKISNIGVNEAYPVITGQSIVFVGKDNTSIFELEVIGDNIALNQINSHCEDIFNSSIISMAYSQFPDPILYVVMKNGDLAVCVFSTSGFRRRWSSYIFGGNKAKAICIVCSNENSIENCWLIVSRNINTNIVYSLELLEKFFNFSTDIEENQKFLDCSFIKQLEIPITNIETLPTITYKYDESLQDKVNICDIIEHFEFLNESKLYERLYYPLFSDFKKVYGNKLVYIYKLNDDDETFVPVVIDNNEDALVPSTWGQPLFCNEDMEPIPFILLYKTTIKITKLQSSINVENIFENIITVDTNLIKIINKFVYIYMRIDGYRVVSANPIDLNGTLFLGKVIGNHEILIHDLNMDIIDQEIEGGAVDIIDALLYIGLNRKISLYNTDDPNVPITHLRVPRIYLDPEIKQALPLNTLVLGELLDIPGATGYNGILYRINRLDEDNEDTEELYYKRYKIDYDNLNSKYNEDGSEVQLITADKYWGGGEGDDNIDIKIIPYTAANGIYDSLDLKIGKFCLIIEYLKYNDIKHLIGCYVKTTTNGFDNKNTFLLEESDFVYDINGNKILPLEEKDKGITVGIGIPYESEAELTALMGGNLFGSSEGSKGFSKKTIVTLHASMGGEYAPSKEDIDHLIPFQYGFTGQVNLKQALINVILECLLYTSRNVTIRTMYIRHNEACNFIMANAVQDFIISEE